MTQSKLSLIISMACILLAIVCIIIGGSIAFTIGCLLFAASGGLYHKSLVELGLEEFQAAIEAGEIYDEDAGDVPETVVDLNEISESDKETLERLFGMTFEIEEEKGK